MHVLTILHRILSTRFPVIHAKYSASLLAAVEAVVTKNVHTITSDNGREFAGHEEIAKNLKADFYFAHLYSSWERGSKENTNRMIRQYFLKIRDFTTTTQQEIDMAIFRLNNRPRKRLGYKTPNQVFFKSGVTLQT